MTPEDYENCTTKQLEDILSSWRPKTDDWGTLTPEYYRVKQMIEGILRGEREVKHKITLDVEANSREACCAIIRAWSVISISEDRFSKLVDFCGTCKPIIDEEIK